MKPIVIEKTVVTKALELDLPYYCTTDVDSAGIRVERHPAGGTSARPLVLVGIHDSTYVPFGGPQDRRAQYMSAPSLRQVAALFSQIADALDAEAAAATNGCPR